MVIFAQVLQFLPIVNMFLLIANNLYGLAQSYPMPLKDFKWLSSEEINLLDVQLMSDDQQTGYILEVDLAYPEKLHKAHSSFPLAPERLDIDERMLSPYAAGMFFITV